MSRWVIPLTTLLVGAAIAVGATLGVTRPWQSEHVGLPTPAAGELEPAFSELEIMRLTTQQVTNLPFPTGTQWVSCTRAVYRSGNGMWVVDCDYRAEKTNMLPMFTRTYTVSDQTGKLQR